MVQKILVEENS